MEEECPALYRTCPILQSIYRNPHSLPYPERYRIPTVPDASRSCREGVFACVGCQIQQQIRRLKEEKVLRENDQMKGPMNAKRGASTYNLHIIHTSLFIVLLTNKCFSWTTPSPSSLLPLPCATTTHLHEIDISVGSWWLGETGTARLLASNCRVLPCLQQSTSNYQNHFSIVEVLREVIAACTTHNTNDIHETVNRLKHSTAYSQFRKCIRIAF